MRNREEILEYIMLAEGYDENFDSIVETAQQIEQEYEEELLKGDVGYGLLSDFINTPFILEDCDIEKIAEINGVVIYKKLIESCEKQPRTNLDNIKIEGRIGTWYEIDRLTRNGETYVLFESEDFGDEAEAVVIKYTDDRTQDGEIPESYEICTTYDNIETALEDEGIL